MPRVAFGVVRIAGALRAVELTAQDGDLGYGRRRAQECRQIFGKGFGGEAAHELMSGSAPEGGRRRRCGKNRHRQQQAGEIAKAEHAFNSWLEVVGPARAVSGIDADERSAVLVRATARRAEFEGLAAHAHEHVALPFLARLLVLRIEEEIAMLQRARLHHEALPLVEAVPTLGKIGTWRAALVAQVDRRGKFDVLAVLPISTWRNPVARLNRMQRYGFPSEPHDNGKQMCTVVRNFIAGESGRSLASSQGPNEGHEQGGSDGFNSSDCASSFHRRYRGNLGCSRRCALCARRPCGGNLVSGDVGSLGAQRQ